MIVNPKKFQAMFISKNKNAWPSNLNIQINDTEVTPQSAIKLLDVTTDNELKFN